MGIAASEYYNPSGEKRPSRWETSRTPPDPETVELSRRKLMAFADLVSSLRGSKDALHFLHQHLKSGEYAELLEPFRRAMAVEEEYPSLKEDLDQESFGYGGNPCAELLDRINSAAWHATEPQRTLPRGDRGRCSP